MLKHERHAAPDLVPTRAIIDIGSNTVRLVIYGGPPRAPNVLHNEKVTAKLGKGVAETGRLSAKASAAALAALGRFRVLLDMAGVREVDAVATAAVRDATDGAAFLDRVRALGFAPRLLSGEEEAMTSAMGVIGAFPGASGVVADLGGGSLELVEIDGSVSRHGVSLPLGTLRLPPLRAQGPKVFARDVGRMLSGEDWAAPHRARLYLVGGSFRAFARFAMEEAAWASDDPHGFELAPDDAFHVARVLARRKGETVAPMRGVSASRLTSLPDAAALLAALVRKLEPSTLVFSSWGLREGLLFGSLAPGERAQDPLLAATSSFIVRQGARPAAATMVAGWTAPANLLGGEGTERLRLAATMLALASANIEPNLRSDVAVDWALRKRWIGVDNAGRAMLAASLLANAGRLELPLGWRRIAPVEALRQAQGWGLAVRLCRRFTGSAAEALGASRLVADGGALRLVVQRPFHALVNDSAERDLKALGAHLGLKAGVEVV